VPINHFSGAYTCDDATYDALVANGQIVLRYKDNPNGSRDDVAVWRTERATWSASCPTRNARCPRCSAAPMVASSSKVSWA